MVEDLASASGTFINGERLDQNVRYLVDDGAQLRFGDLEASYFPPPPAEAVAASTSETDATFSPTGLHVALTSPAVAIDPGRQATATLTVTNRGRVVDTIRIEVTDLPPEWYTLEATRSSLLPGSRTDVQVILHPPRRHDALAGHYDFTVKVTSNENQREAIAIGSFDVLPFESFGLSFEAVRSSRNFRLIAENRGNEAVACTLAGQDDEQAFQYEFDSPAVQLRPGQKQVVALKVLRQRQLFGPKIALPFEVIAKATTGSAVSARGQISIDPPLQKFGSGDVPAGPLILGVPPSGILILSRMAKGQTAALNRSTRRASTATTANLTGRTQQEKERQSSPAPRTPPAVVAGLYDGGRPIFGHTDANGAPLLRQRTRWGTDESLVRLKLRTGRTGVGTPSRNVAAP